MEKKLLEYFKGDDFCSTVWKSKYAQAGEETPDDMHKRMAKEFARVRFIKDQSKNKNEWELYFFDIFKDFKKNVPQGRVMAGVGVYDSYRSLSNCLRLPPPQDSYSSIMEVDTMLVSSAKRGCGYGLGLSNLRPRGAKTNNSSKTSTGVIPFAERYSNSTKEVGQEGRRGACLEDLDIRHPQATDWATVKLDKTKVTGANISFKMWEDFLIAVEKNEDYFLRFPCDLDLNKFSYDYYNANYNELHYIEDHTNNYKVCYVKKVKAKELWDSAIHTVWSDGCPGLLFWERVVNYDPSSVYKQYQIDGTNACGEQPMAIFDTCRLLTQMLLAIVDKPFTKEATINYERLYEYSYIQMEIGDDLIDLEIEYLQRIIDKIKSDPEDESTKAIELKLWTNVLEMAKNGRRVGGGITALADMLASINVKYDSEEALKVVEKVMSVKFKAELNASIDLAIKYGTFKGWDASLEKNGNDWYRFVEKDFPEEWEKMQKYGRRFINWSTIAPVGTTSIITKGINYPNVSSGCEPQFSLYYFRNKKVETDSDPYDYIDEVGIKWKQYPVMMGAFKDWLIISSYTDEEGIEKGLSKDYLDHCFTQSPWYGCTANDISWEKRIELQSVLQKYTTSAISSTINLPKDVKEEVISDIYMYAWKKGLKGITCYRDGSKGNVLSHDAFKNNSFEYKDALKRPKSLKCDIHSITSKGIKWNVLVGLLDEKPYEVFAVKHFTDEHNLELVKIKQGRYDLLKNGETYSENITSEMNAEEEVITRLVSTGLRHGTDVKFLVEQLNKAGGDITSFSKAVSRILKKYIPEGAISTVKCEDCGSSDVIFKEGCQSCSNCGNSKCS